MSGVMQAELSNRPDASASAPPQPLTIHVNGEPRQTQAATLAALIEEAGYGQARVATALNGDFIPARARAATPLKTGDQVEIVAPRQGG